MPTDMCIVHLVHNCERDCFRIATAVHSAHQCWQGILGEVFQLRLFTSTQTKVDINDQWVRGKSNTGSFSKTLLVKWS